MQSTHCFSSSTKAANEACVCVPAVFIVSSQLSSPSWHHGTGEGKKSTVGGEREREGEGGEKVGEGMPCLPHYTAVIYSSSPVLFSGIKTGCKFDS